jgi:hypothetical protein
LLEAYTPRETSVATTTWSVWRKKLAPLVHFNQKNIVPLVPFNQKNTQDGIFPPNHYFIVNMYGYWFAFIIKRDAYTSYS